LRRLEAAAVDSSRQHHLVVAHEQPRATARLLLFVSASAPHRAFAAVAAPRPSQTTRGATSTLTHRRETDRVPFSSSDSIFKSNRFKAALHGSYVRSSKIKEKRKRTTTDCEQTFSFRFLIPNPMKTPNKKKYEGF